MHTSVETMITMVHDSTMVRESQNINRPANTTGRHGWDVADLAHQLPHVIYVSFAPLLFWKAQWKIDEVESNMKFQSENYCCDQDWGPTSYINMGKVDQSERHI